jgi:oligopeptide/dipeptide ABC transporter ATP-binding protein
VEGLRVTFPTATPVRGLSFTVRRGEAVGVVGESGSGKTLTALAVAQLIEEPGQVRAERLEFAGQDLRNGPSRAQRRVLGTSLAMVFQDPMTSFNPVYKVGDQIVEQIRAHRHEPEAAARDRAIELLDAVGIPDAERRFDHYPHEFSGGMRQRAMIAMALTLDPQILIADEPSTALDVTIQAQILRLIERLNAERDLSVILITHDLGVVAEVADRVLVMYAGRVVEEGSLDEIFYDPQHPYTWGLLGSLTRLDRPRAERLTQIKGQPPSLLAPPQGCHFRPRCPHAFDRCTEVPPLEVRVGGGVHADRCWLEPERKRSLREVEGRVGLEAA